jgi:16S rRNA (uracil1498-N3)-methyltransferase
MRQFVLPPEWDGAGPCRIAGRSARYLLKVLRLGPGDGFAGLDAQGRRRACSVTEVGDGWLLVSVSSPQAGPGKDATLADTRASRGKKTAGPSTQPGTGSESGPHHPPGAGRKPLPRIILVQSIAKAPAMDLVLRQAAEAGVARVIPLAARRSVPKTGQAGEGGKLERWERIIREGLQQSGSPIATTIEEAVEAAGLAERLGPPRGERLGLVLHEVPLAQTGLHEYLGNAPEEIVICVGPEGGFADDELEILAGAGFKPLLLPGAILRTETAALYAVAAVETILAERSSWTPSS